MIITRTIETARLNDVMIQIKKVEKRIKSKVEITVSNRHFIEASFDDAMKNFYNPNFNYTIEVADVTINVPDIEYVIPGYEVIGAIDYTEAVQASRLIEDAKREDIKGLVYLFNDKFSEVVEPFRYFINARCDHCNTKRSRHSIVVLNKIGTDEIMVVGKSCVKFFLKHNFYPEDLFRVHEFKTCFEEHESFGKHTPLAYVDNIIAQGLAMVDNYGYTSRKEEEEHWDKGVSSTATRTSYAMFDRKGWEKKYPYEEIPEETEKNKAEAKEIIEWIKNDPKALGTTSFSENLRMLIEAGAVKSNKLTMVVATIGFWMHHKEYLERLRKASENRNEYIGNIGDKVELIVKLERYKMIESNTYNSYLFVFRTEDGRSVNWFASTDWDIEIGETVKIRGTVKNHKEYNGTKQTTLTRCKIE